MRPLLCLGLFVLATATHAGIYKWVDSQGKVHFSDSPPAGKTSQTVKVTPSSGMGGSNAPAAKQSTLAEQEAAFNKRRMDKAEAETKAQKETEKAEQKQQYCRDLKGHLAGLKSANARLVKYDENGKRQTLNSSDKQAEISKTEEAIQQSCSG